MKDQMKKDPRLAVEMKLFKIQLLIAKGEGIKPGGMDMSSNPKMVEGRILALLSLQRELSKRKLGFVIGTNPKLTSEILTELEGKGYVELIADAEEKRKVTVKITDEGEKALEERKNRTPEPKIPFDNFSEDEISALNESLSKIIEALKKKYGIRKEG